VTDADQPARLRALAAAAEAVARGDLDTRVPVPDDNPELADAARAFNEVLDAVCRSRAELEARGRGFGQVLIRLGEVLAATHDRPAIISAVLETTALAVAARAAVFYGATPGGGTLEGRISYGDAAEGIELAAGEGLAGAAERDVAVVLWPGPVEPSQREPDPAAAAAALPVRSGNRVLGVLAVYGPMSGRPFSDDEVQMLETLVRQAEIAIDNSFLYDEATKQSITDGLTGLWNRRLFDLRTAEELQRAIRFQEPFAVLMVDIDHFKAVNDEHGHQAGDAVLIELARRLTEATREVDVVTRYGGEEFALILPKTGVDGAMRLAEKIKEAMVAEPFAAGDALVPVSVSIGVAAYPDHGLSVPEIISAADAALYRAKAGGRDRVEEARPEGKAPMRSAGI
jgi:diguanylate cyclase (GGDEF)-like protein